MKKMLDATSKETITVKIYTTNEYQIHGQVTVIGAYRSRLSDLLNNEKPFVALTNVKVYDLKGSLINKHAFLCINKQAIRFAIEEERSLGDLQEYYQMHAYPMLSDRA